MSARLNFKTISIHTGPKQSPGFLLWRVSTLWRSSIEAILKTMDLTHPQFVVLATAGWLTRNGDCVTQVMIGKMAGLDPNTNSQVIKALEEKELIKRSPSSDGRAKNVALTSIGASILSRAMSVGEKEDVNFFGLLSKEELSALCGTFQKLIQRKPQCRKLAKKNREERDEREKKTRRKEGKQKTIIRYNDYKDKKYNIT